MLIILGILALIMLIFFGPRLLQNRAAVQKEEVRTQAGEATDESQEASETSSNEAAPTLPPVADSEEDETVDDLTQEEEPHPFIETPAEVKSLIDTYYAALSVQDVPGVEAIVDYFTDDDALDIVHSAPAAYKDVTSYVKNGPEENTYVVYTCYQYEEEGKEAAAQMTPLYIVPDENGRLVIKYQKYTAAEEAYINKLSNEEDVIALANRAQTGAAPETSEAESAAAAEETAAEQAASAEEAAAEAAAAEAPAEAPAEAAEASGNEPQNAGHINHDCNVRSGAGYGYDPVGVIKAGTEVTVIGERGKGWTHIRNAEFDGYVGSQFVD